MDPQRARPVFFSLHRIRFPVTAVVSITHRVSGVVVALTVPALVYLLQLSIAGPHGFERAAALLRHGLVRSSVVLLLCVLGHHVFAGVRHLLFDIHVGTRYGAARLSAWAVFAADIAVVALAIGLLT